MQHAKSKKVYVGLSGGVDSSVSALLLKQQGYDVTGVFIKVWHPDFLQCDWKSEMRDAMRVCAALRIPFKKLDLEDVYKKHIIDYMIEEYKVGRTPNPDVMCNKYVKFGAFLDWARQDGADYVATGHYVQNIHDEKRDRYFLHKAVDQSKDQTYFLWTLTPDQLKYSLFPIGHLKKTDVRNIAEKNNLFTSIKKDSQGLCFIGHVDMKEFLGRYIDTQAGDVVNEHGDVVGSHDGAQLYTIGERHGFSLLPDVDRKLPYYVVDKNITKNTITVSQHPTQEQHAESCVLRDATIDLTSEKLEQEFQAQIRYHGQLYPVHISKTSNEVLVTFSEKQTGVTLGQSCVVYDGDRCVGGGIIDSVL